VTDFALGPGTQSGIASGLWIALLWFAAPIFDGEERSNDTASRVRDALLLGVAIPGVLAFVHVLYGRTGICAAIAVAIVRVVRHPPRRSRASPASRPVAWSALPIFFIVGCAWPLLVRPLLDGDSLSYHLPNAVAWVHAHGIWVADTRYWWYPGGSELFAAGLFAVAGPFGIPLCGTLALSLLGLPIVTFVPKLPLRRSTIGLTVLASIAYAGRLAGDHAASYYDDRVARDSTGRGLYTWLATVRPTTVVVRGTLADPVEIASPATRMIESVAGSGCRTARDEHALLLATVDRHRPSASELHDAKRCDDVFSKVKTRSSLGRRVCNDSHTRIESRRTVPRRPATMRFR
jgi:hypothetical protein